MVAKVGHCRKVGTVSACILHTRECDQFCTTGNGFFVDGGCKSAVDIFHNLHLHPLPGKVHPGIDVGGKFDITYDDFIPLGKGKPFGHQRDPVGGVAYERYFTFSCACDPGRFFSA